MIIPNGTTNPPIFGTGYNIASLRLGVVIDQPRMPEHVGRSGFDLARDQRLRSHIAFWVLPFWWAIGPLFVRSDVSLGATIPFHPRKQAVLEAGAEFGNRTSPNSGTRFNHTMLHASMGVAFLFANRGPLRGFFIEPKVYASDYVPDSRGDIAGEITAGLELDIGYQYTAGPLYLAPVIGLGAGYTTVLGGTPAQQSHVVPLYNLSVLRIGVAF
jgi:hypothetical protein